MDREDDVLDCHDIQLEANVQRKGLGESLKITTL